MEDDHLPSHARTEALHVETLAACSHAISRKLRLSGMFNPNGSTYRQAGIFVIACDRSAVRIVISLLSIGSGPSNRPRPRPTVTLPKSHGSCAGADRRRLIVSLYLHWTSVVTNAAVEKLMKDKLKTDRCSYSSWPYFGLLPDGECTRASVWSRHDRGRRQPARATALPRHCCLIRGRTTTSALRSCAKIEKKAPATVARRC